MSKKEEAKIILQKIGMPNSQQSDICCWSLIALCDISQGKEWKSATNKWLRIHDIISFIGKEYNVKYAENSRETFRKQAIHHFVNAALIENNGEPTNSPKFRYRITKEFLNVVQHYENLDKYSNVFNKKHKKLIEEYASKKRMTLIPVKINANNYSFSSGKHNQLQKKILEDFAPRFAGGSSCLYVGDTTEKDLYKDSDTLKKLGFNINVHNKMPDVILYSKDKDWLFFIEAVTSVGPMDPKRIKEINKLTKKCKSGKIFITAFLDFKTYKQFSEQLAWETEIWIADMPDHMIHLNGDKFMGPRK